MDPTIPTTYRGYQYDNYGSVDEELKQRTLEQKPLAPSQVRVKVHTAGINPVDYLLIEMGNIMFPNLAPPTPNQPFNLGMDFAGTIIEVGDQVKRFKLGDQVFAMSPFDGFGTVAEYFAVDEKVLALKPANVTFEQAAAMPLAALASYQVVFQHTKLQPGEIMLIIGGSSSTGSFAIQFAKSVGAKVIATTSTPNIELVKKIGADQVIDYKTEKWYDVLDENSVDVLLDCGMEADAWDVGAQKVLKANTGRFQSLWPLTEPVSEPKFGAINIGFQLVQPGGEDLTKIADMMASGKVKPVIDSVFEFDDLRKALARVQTRRCPGKVVIRVH